MHRAALTVACSVAVAVAAAAPPAWAQAPAAGVNWVNGTPELPKKREAGVAAEGPLEGPEHPQIREFEDAFREGTPVMLFWWWPGSTGPGKACQVWETEIWKSAEAPKAMEEWLCIRVNAKKCPKEVMKHYKVAKVPTIQLYFCDRKMAKSIGGTQKDPEKFAQQLVALAKKNDAIWAKIKKQRAKLEGKLEAAAKLKDAGKLDDAAKAYTKLLKTAVGEDAKWGLRELKIVKIVAEGEKLYKEGNYPAARGRFLVASDFEVPCPARDTARKLLPECEAGVKYLDALRHHKEGDTMKAIESLQKIINDEWYEGEFRAKAEAKIKELKEAWGKK
ncbi:MAG: hypothetical protein ACYTGX_19025 [Planctomycetota bacterium]|jgi:hypothetical protein